METKLRATEVLVKSGRVLRKSRSKLNNAHVATQAVARTHVMNNGNTQTEC